MDFRYGSYFGSTPPEAYERLICDCILGDSTLFAREDEVLDLLEAPYACFTALARSTPPGLSKLCRRHMGASSCRSDACKNHEDTGDFYDLLLDERDMVTHS